MIVRKAAFEVLAGALLILAAPAVAATTPADPPAARAVDTAKPDPSDPDVVICRRELDTGSRIKSTKVCMPRRQWSELSREAGKAVTDMHSSTPTGN